MFTRTELKEQAKAQMAGKIWPIFGVSLLAGLIGGAANLICNIIPVVGFIGSYFVSAAITVGILTIYMNVTYGDEVRIEDLFVNLKRILPATLLFFLMGLFIILWSLLLIVPGIIMGIAYSMAWYIFMENPELDAMTCIKKSKELMNGHKMDYFVLCLSFIPWIVLVWVTAGIAGIYVVPYMALTQVNFYHRIKGEIDLPCNNTSDIVDAPVTEPVETPSTDTIAVPEFPDVNNNEAFNDPFANQANNESDESSFKGMHEATSEEPEADDAEAYDAEVEAEEVEADEADADEADADEAADNDNDSVYY